MQLYKVSILPSSGFVTSLKGDTLFGQLCWLIALDNEKRLEELLSEYDEKPFLIFSDGFVKNHLPKPNMPSKLLNENEDTKKHNRKKTWMELEHLLAGEYEKAKEGKCIDKQEGKKEEKTISTIKNSLDYKTFTTHESFDPYAIVENIYNEKDIYFLLDEQKMSLDELKGYLKTLSLHGYGKKTTIGKGRFEIGEYKKIDTITQTPTNIFMSLSPLVLSSKQKSFIKEFFYEPFTRFGKHGALAKTNPFKKPLLLANTASVIITNEKTTLKYLGKAIKNVSEIQKKAIHQGYSIVLPLKGINYEEL